MKKSMKLLISSVFTGLLAFGIVTDTHATEVQSEKTPTKKDVIKWQGETKALAKRLQDDVFMKDVERDFNVMYSEPVSYIVHDVFPVDSEMDKWKTKTFNTSNNPKYYLLLENPKNEQRFVTIMHEDLFMMERMYDYIRIIETKKGEEKETRTLDLYRDGQRFLHIDENGNQYFAKIARP